MRVSGFSLRNCLQLDGFAKTMLYLTDVRRFKSDRRCSPWHKGIHKLVEVWFLFLLAFLVFYWGDKRTLLESFWFIRALEIVPKKALEISGEVALVLPNMLLNGRILKKAAWVCEMKGDLASWALGT